MNYMACRFGAFVHDDVRFRVEHRAQVALKQFSRSVYTSRRFVRRVGRSSSNADCFLAGSVRRLSGRVRISRTSACKERFGMRIRSRLIRSRCRLLSGLSGSPCLIRRSIRAGRSRIRVLNSGVGLCNGRLYTSRRVVRVASRSLCFVRRIYSRLSHRVQLKFKLHFVLQRLHIQSFVTTFVISRGLA